MPNEFQRLLAGIWVLGGGLCAALAVSPVAAAARLPNIVLIISDDQAWTDYGFMGHPVIQTPCLDRLAREGACFPRGYVPTALCRPSLATLITGLYAHQHGITGNDPVPPAGRSFDRSDPEYLARCEQLIARIDNLPTVPRLLAERGYVSFQAGKWWEGHSRRGGFTAGMTHGDPAAGGRHGDEGLTIGRQGLQPVFDFITSAGDQPFFIWYAPFLPHAPHTPPAELLARYTSPERPEALARYWAMCEWFDATCGALLDYLDQRGLSDNTLVVYVADNGWIQRTPQTDVPPTWRHEFAPRSKQTAYEGGVRTPILLRWPGRIPPQVRTEPVSSIDLVPTMLAACGAASPLTLPGRDLLAVCRGEASPPETICGEVFAHDIADLSDPRKSLLNVWAIEGDWKLIWYVDGTLDRYRDVHAARPREPQLFDLQADPHELRNRAAEHPDIVARLHGRLRAWWPEAPLDELSR
jgi:uncharacterized sulfatase